MGKLKGVLCIDFFILLWSKYNSFDHSQEFIFFQCLFLYFAFEVVLAKLFEICILET
jgi:uncharacterized membrane protein required for colicin V production